MRRWELIRLCEIPERIRGLMGGLYPCPESAVKFNEECPFDFFVNTGVRQGCVLAPSLFSTCTD